MIQKHLQIHHSNMEANLMTRQNISSGSPYEPVIGFSRAVRVGDTIAVGGTAPIGPDGRTVGIGDPGAQTRRCLEIIAAALAQAGAGMDNVVRTRIMLRDIRDWESVGRVHGEFFEAIRPASTLVQVAQFIDPDWRVEIEADAIITPEGR
jgi:enamine deaminase RidA (YjgF/YER057c/UK114 family)